MINAKLKIVLKELPSNIQEVNKLVWIPLENQAKAVPGGIELGSTPVDLLATKKMWNKAKKKADAMENPIYIIEALIGFREGKFTVVASSIQVTQGKSKEQETKEKE